MTQAFALFETAIGCCGIAWGERGILGVQLPEGNAAKTRARLRRRFQQAQESAPTPPIGRAIDGVVALLAGELVDLTEIRIDVDRVEAFDRRVYQTARTLAPPGSTVTYGELAAALGDGTLARDVGQALGRNPWPLIVPCHRVLAAHGKLGGFSAHGGIATKIRLLNIERPRTSRSPTLFDDDPQFALAAKPRPHFPR